MNKKKYEENSIYSRFGLYTLFGCNGTADIEWSCEGRFRKTFSGVKISKAGEFRINSITDESGVFSLELEEGDYIDLNYADVVLKRVKVTGETMNIVLDSHKDGMSDLGFMKRTEENRTQSVSTIYADQLMKGATSTNRVNNALFGLIPGLQLSQNAAGVRMPE